MAFTFPSGLLDDTEGILALLGTFWQECYRDRDPVWALCRARAETERQTFQDALEAGGGFGAATCPVRHTDVWRPLVLRDGNRRDGYPFLYGSGGLYGPDHLYGEADSSAVGWSAAYLGADGLSECHVITSGIAAPLVVLTEGVDFSLDLDRGVVVFRDDPFLNPLLAQDGEGAAAAITLWAFRAGFERHHVRDQYGYALGVEHDSSEEYRSLIATLVTGLAAGPSLVAVRRLLSALAGVRLAAGGETVEAVVLDAAHLLVLTDRNVYRFPKASTPLVAAGAALAAGQPLVDTLLLDLADGAAPVGVTELEVPASFLDGPAGPLTFGGGDETLVVTPGVAGKTMVTFDIGGDPADVAAFFDALHAKGVASGVTLANCLDLRPQPQDTEPTADSLPATINPLELLFGSVFRGNLLLVRVRPTLFGPGALGLDPVWAVRQLLPPHLAVLVVSAP